MGANTTRTDDPSGNAVRTSLSAMRQNCKTQGSNRGRRMSVSWCDMVLVNYNIYLQRKKHTRYSVIKNMFIIVSRCRHCRLLPQRELRVDNIGQCFQGRLCTNYIHQQ